MVGKLNQIITVNTLSNTVDVGGGVSRSVASSFDLWAYVENKTGQANFIEGQRQAEYDYKITCRWYAAKEVTTAKTITYGSKTLKVQSVQIKDEGKQKWQIIKCTVHGGN